MLFSGSDAGDENADEFVGFFEERRQQFSIFGEWDALDEFEPALRFAQLLQACPQTVNEVAA